MPPQPPNGPEASPGDVTRRTSLAAERTFLAWWRTGLTSFAVALGAGAILPDIVADSRPRWPYVLVGCGFAIVGAIAVIYGTLRERAVRRAAARGEWVPAGDAIMLVLTGLLVGLAIGLLALLIGTG